MTEYSKIIIGAGFYGLYSALFCVKNIMGGAERILILECDPAPFMRATYINQARVHQGYHYPRSISTALKSAGYFERFSKDFSFCINKSFDQIYGTSSSFSWTDREEFKKFCVSAGIPCEELNPDRYFKKGMCDGAFLTQEYTYDASLLKRYLVEQLSNYNNVEIKYGVSIESIYSDGDYYVLTTSDGNSYKTDFLLNTTYAGTNQILDMLGFDKFKIKYELCEIILCLINDKLKDVGFTVMDGPFFSIMPFGKTGMHSLTSVTFTPHATSYDELPGFACQEESVGYCDKYHLGNCNECPAKPDTAFPYMANLARKYMKDEYGFNYESSLFSMKPILMSSEIDDSRPTVIRVHSEKPKFISVLSGKINTVYDMEEVLRDA